MNNLDKLNVAENIKIGLRGNGIVLDGDFFSKKDKIIEDIKHHFRENNFNFEILELDIQEMFSDEKSLESNGFIDIYNTVLRLSKVLAKDGAILIFVKHSNLIKSLIKNYPNSKAPVDSAIVFKNFAKISCVKVVFDDIPFEDEEFSKLYNTWFVD